MIEREGQLCQLYRFHFGRDQGLGILRPDAGACAMELGEAPAIICSDADLEIAARSVVWGAFTHCGQVCASVERVYVMEDIYDQYVSRVVALTKMIRQKNQLSGWDVDVGAMTDKNQIKIIQEQIEDALNKGAKVLTGGKNPRWVRCISSRRL